MILNAGLTLHFHYCGGKLTSVSIFNLCNKKCSECGKKLSKDCCQDREQKLTLNDSTVMPDVNIAIPILTNTSFELTNYIGQLCKNNSLISFRKCILHKISCVYSKVPINIRILSIVI